MPNSWPKLALAGSAAAYWLLTEADLTNMQVTVIALDHTRRVFPEPHVAVRGTVAEVIAEADGDHHIWLTYAGSPKARLACEVTPQQPLPVPAVGEQVTVYGILRYDLQHQWWEIHPVDAISREAV